MCTVERQRSLGWEKMDPLYMANSLFRRRRYEDCVQVCTEILEANPYDQVQPLPNMFTTPAS